MSTADRPTTEPPWWSWDTDDDDSWLAEFSGEDVRALVRERNRLAEAAQGAAPRAEGLDRERERIAIELNHYDLSDDPGYIKVPTERVRAILRARLTEQEDRHG